MKNKKQIQEKINAYKAQILICKERIDKLKKDTDWTARKQLSMQRQKEIIRDYEGYVNELEWVLGLID